MKAKILVAENERIVAIDIKNSLQRLGFKVTGLVSTGEEVMKKIKEEKPDLILMDIKLDGPISGIKTAEIIADHYNIPVIYLTAYSDRETLQQAKITEPYGYLIKPFDSREIEIAIEMAFIQRGISFEDTTGPIYPVIYN
jgi:hypothetical protein